MRRLIELLASYSVISILNHFSIIWVSSVLPGDFLGGSVFAASHEGESVVDVLNYLDVDYFTLGNHEFDFGAKRVEELMGKSNFKWLGSNVRHSVSRSLFNAVLDTDVFDVNITSKDVDTRLDTIKRVAETDSNCATVRVGVFGVCTEFTPMLSDPGDEVVFEDVLEHSARCVQILKGKECDYIIALTHLELENDKRLAENLDINIIIGKRIYFFCMQRHLHRLILFLFALFIYSFFYTFICIGGHEHTPFYFEHSGTTIIKCGQNMDYLGILDLSFFKEKNSKYVGKIEKNKQNIAGNFENNDSIRNDKNNDNKYIVKATNNFQLVLTEGTPCDDRIDDVIKKWNDSVPEKDGAGEILCTVGIILSNCILQFVFHVVLVLIF